MYLAVKYFILIQAFDYVHGSCPKTLLLSPHPPLQINCLTVLRRKSAIVWNEKILRPNFEKRVTIGHNKSPYISVYINFNV